MIKDKRVLAMLVIAVSVVSCTGKFSEKLFSDSSESRIRCILEDDSRLHLSNGKTPVWDASDSIAVLSADAVDALAFKLVEGAGTSRGTFAGYLCGDGPYAALSPFNASASRSGGTVSFSTKMEQPYTQDSFASGSSPMAAVFNSDTRTVSFKNLFGLLELSFLLSPESPETPSVRKIVIEDNNGDALWGNFSFSLNEGDGNFVVHSTGGGSSKATMSFSSAVQLSKDNPLNVFFSLPPGTLSKGFSVSLFRRSGDTEPFYTISTSKDRTIVRSGFRKMDVVDDIVYDGGGDPEPLPEPDMPTKPQPFTWAACNSIGSGVNIDPQTSGYRSTQTGKKVGMFYFVWHGCHGYESAPSGSAYGQWAAPATSSNPRNIQDMLGAGNYAYNAGLSYGPEQSAHFWGQPYIGYYIQKDHWVYRKHAQMLSDAGVDFIALDLTNGYAYIDVIEQLCYVFRAVRNEGNNTPQLTFMLNKDANLGDIVALLDQRIYPTYSDLWFQLDGKPLILADGNSSQLAGYRSRYTFRKCWYLWNENWGEHNIDNIQTDWWGDGTNKWYWGSLYNGGSVYPVGNGNEQAAVMPATHPVANIGRSYSPKTFASHEAMLTDQYAKDPSQGTYFKAQFNAAFKQDPRILFFTGWNEWVAQKYPSSTTPYMCGTRIPSGSPQFVDLYNHEFSRDLEPVAGSFGDIYYYYTADFIRKFKGVDELPQYHNYHEIVIDASFSDWSDEVVKSGYVDDSGDNAHQSWYRWGNPSKTSLTNNTGRNDLIVSKITTDGSSAFFYLKTNVQWNWGGSPFGSGLRLFIRSGVPQKSWEGFNYMVEISGSTATLFISNGGWDWTAVQGVQLAVANDDRHLEMSVPLSSLGIADPDEFSLDFKWTDNVDLTHSDGIQRCMRDGDSAPNGRFRYRYVFSR